MSSEPEVVNLMWGGEENAPKREGPLDLEKLIDDAFGWKRTGEIEIKHTDGHVQIIDAEETPCDEGCQCDCDEREVEIVELPFLAEGFLGIEYPPVEQRTEFLQSLEGLPETQEIAGREFKNITSEAYRAYGYVVGDNVRYLVFNDPLYVNVSESGSHRLVTADGISHWVSPGFLTITWAPRDGEQNFRF